MNLTAGARMVGCGAAGVANGFPGAHMVGALFEACVESVEEAREAESCGADRVELCIDLANDGCTPPSSLAARCSGAIGIPMIAMVRPRPGDFVYTQAEVDAMCGAMEGLREGGAAGFATGALTSGGEIDLRATARLVAAAGTLPVTFHRAFDHLPRLEDGLEALVALGVRRILTSGAAPSAVAGIDRLRQLVARAAGRIEVIAAGGIRPHTVERVIESTGAPWVHARWSGWRRS